LCRRPAFSSNHFFERWALSQLNAPPSCGWGGKLPPSERGVAVAAGATAAGAGVMAAPP